MKTLNSLLFLFAIILTSGCIPDSFTEWNLEPPSSTPGGGGSGVTPPGPGGPVPPPPTSFTYTPAGPYVVNLTTDASATIPSIVPISTGGGEIVPGFITFTLAQVQDINGNATTTVWPNSLSMDPNTGIISGRPNQFINHNTYTINATPLGAVLPIQTKIEISMATAPGKIYYPQVNGQTLLLEVTSPGNFQVGNYVTDQNNAKGTVTSVDINNKNIYITVICTQAPCPNFNVGDKIDNKDGYFLEQSTINKVVYGFTLPPMGIGIQNMVAVTNPDLSGEQPQYAITPDITLHSGVHFSTTTGEIWSDGSFSTPIPNTKYTVTVKNILGQTTNAIINIQALGVSNPTSPDSVEYAYLGGDRVVVELIDNSQFTVEGKISNQNGTSGTIKDFLTSGTPGSIPRALIDIDAWSESAFQSNQPVDNGYPYILQASSISSQSPILVHQIGSSFSFKPTLAGNLSPSDLDTLSWTSNPELPHLCQSITSTPTTYYKENTDASTDPASCTNAHGTCSIATITNGFDCENAAPTPGSWTSSAKYLTEYANELWFNRRTGEFGAFNPQKTFPGQTFDVSVTSLIGVVLNTKTAISFEGVPKNLAYASDVLLEVMDDSAFDIGDQISSNGTGVGVVTYKFNATIPPAAPGYTPTGKILVVRTTSGVFLDGEDIDNVSPFQFQKGEIIKAKYNSLGIQVSSISNFKTDEEVSVTTPNSASGIINYIDPDQNTLWVVLKGTTNTSLPIESFSSNGNPVISAAESGASANIYGIIGDNVALNLLSSAGFNAGLDVTATPASPTLTCNSGGWMAANPMGLPVGFNGVNPQDGCYNSDIYTPIVGLTGSVFYVNILSTLGVTVHNDRTNLGGNISLNQGYAAVFVSDGTRWVYQGSAPNSQSSFINAAGMSNLVSGSNVYVSVANGKFISSLSLNRYNPSNSTEIGNSSQIIQGITYNPIFYLDRNGTSGIQPVILSPPNNGVVYSISPALPTGLNFDSDTGQINVVAPGPVSSVLKNYTVTASNFLGASSYTFGLEVREVFSITDVTNNTGNLTGILHKSGQGYSRFPCRITQEQIRSQAQGNARGKNINCLYDVGEGELYSNGLELQVNVGSNLCTYIEHVPYFFYQWQYQRTDPNTNPAVMEHTGDFNNVICGPGQPNGSITQYPDGAPNTKCLGNQGGALCDDGSIKTIQRDYELQGVCYDSAAGFVAGVTDFATCFGDPNVAGSTAGNPAGNRSYCSSGALVDRTTCLDANDAWNSNYAFINGRCWFIQSETDAVTCSDNYGTCTGGTGGANRNLCTAGGGVWNSTGLFVSNANCFSSAGVSGPDFECGGSQLNCINGPAKDDQAFPQSALTDRWNTYIRGNSIPIGNNPITFTYNSPLSKDYQSNIYLSNFSRANACTPYNGNIYEYDMGTWFNVGYNLNPSTQSTDSPFSGGNGVYAIRCLDGAANIIGQINLVIREWDHDFKAKDGTDIMDFSGNPIDGVGNDDFGYPENTYEDWDNQSLGGTCSSPTYTYPASNL